jgi:hypothetical protein
MGWLKSTCSSSLARLFQLHWYHPRWLSHCVYDRCLVRPHGQARGCWPLPPARTRCVASLVAGRLPHILNTCCRFGSGTLKQEISTACPSSTKTANSPHRIFCPPCRLILAGKRRPLCCGCCLAQGISRTLNCLLVCSNLLSAGSRNGFVFMWKHKGRLLGCHSSPALS